MYEGRFYAENNCSLDRPRVSRYARSPGLRRREETGPIVFLPEQKSTNRRIRLRSLHPIYSLGCLHPWCHPIHSFEWLHPWCHPINSFECLHPLCHPIHSIVCLHPWCHPIHSFGCLHPWCHPINSFGCLHPWCNPIHSFGILKLLFVHTPIKSIAGDKLHNCNLPNDWSRVLNWVATGSVDMLAESV